MDLSAGRKYRRQCESGAQDPFPQDSTYGSLVLTSMEEYNKVGDML